MWNDQKTEAELRKEVDVLRRHVSELEQAQSALRPSEKQLKELFDNVVVGIYRTTPDGRIIMANSAFVQMLGFSSFEELSEKKVDDEGFAPGYPRPTFKNLIEKKGKVIGFESAFLRRDGTTIFVRENARVVRDSSSRVLCYEGIVEDITERKKAEDALKQYQLMVESAQDAIFFKDLKSRYIVANKKTLEAFGLPREQVIGKNDYKIMPDKEEAKKNIESDNVVFQTGKPIEITKQMTGRDGKKHWFQAVKVPQFDNKGKIIGLVGVARDITEFKKDEESLKEAEQRFRSIFDNAADGMLLADVESKKLYAGNKAICQALGYDAKEIKNLGVMDIHPKEDMSYVIEQFDKQTRGEFTLAKDIPVKRKDGSVFYAEVNSMAITLAGKTYLMGIFRDITERRKAEEALRQSESKYKTLLENLSQKIFLKDRNSVYISCNENYARDMKIKPEEIAGKTDYDFYPKKLAEKYRADDKRIMEGGKTEDIEEKYIHGGQELIVRTVKTPVKDQQGSVIGILGIFWDITESKRQEAELSTYREKMAVAEKLASLGTLSATLAHELTQPLTVIGLSVENALAELKATSCDKTVIDQLEDGLGGVENATSIVEEFRNFAKKSSERSVRKVGLKAVAERIVKLLNERARRARVSLRMKGMGELPPVYCNEKELEQLFFALLDNAIQAADGKKDRKVVVSGLIKDKHIELRFSDNCGGIAPENIDKIFEPFFTTKPPSEGTGLGLCIVQSIVSHAGGKAWVKSKPGAGSTFFVTLPIGKDGKY